MIDHRWVLLNQPGLQMFLNETAKIGKPLKTPPGDCRWQTYPKPSFYLKLVFSYRGTSGATTHMFQPLLSLNMSRFSVRFCSVYSRRFNNAIINEVGVGQITISL